MKTIIIGKQEWMIENLNVSEFSDGKRIIEARTDDEWRNAFNNKAPAWCYYNNDQELGNEYGKLYNWYAIIDSSNLAPKGWGIPSSYDWEKLISFLGGYNKAGLKMKSTIGWMENGNGSNESGFSAKPGGKRLIENGFIYQGSSSLIWASNIEGMHYDVYSGGEGCYPNKLNLGFNGIEGMGCSVSCFRDLKNL